MKIQRLARDAPPESQGREGNSDQPLVSVVMIFFNADEMFFRDAIESVFRQTYDNWELLFVDDGSTDGSTNVALRYAHAYPDRVRYLEHEGHQNLGMSAARNLGVRNAAGRYVALLDADDLWLPEKLEKQVAILEAHPQAGMVYGSSWMWHSWTGDPADAFYDHRRDWGVQAIHTDTLVEPPALVTIFLQGAAPTPSTCSILMRRELVEDVGGFEESFTDTYEDTAFLYKVCLKTPVFVETGCWDRYRQHPNSGSHIAEAEGRYHPYEVHHDQAKFLHWFETYLEDEKFDDPSVREALRGALRPHRRESPPPIPHQDSSAITKELIPAPPDLYSEYLERGDQLWTDGRVNDALRAYEEGLKHCAERHLLHKRIAGLLETTRGIDAAFRYYGLERIDEGEISISQDEILCGAIVRDEEDLLPFFLDYHDRLGVDRFLVVDNLSQDATRDILLANSKVHLWQTGEGFWAASCGAAWMEVLFRRFARGHWCLVVDADELFYYPDVDTRRLQHLCDQLDRTGKVALPAVLLDMYSDRPVRDSVYRTGQDPVEVCPFFDGEFFHWRGTAGPWQNFEGFAGGLRRRVFGGDNYPFLSKIPLFRYTTDRVIAAGWHSTNAPPDEIAKERAALLHFKFTARFVDRLEDERSSERRMRDSSQSYSTYARAFASQPDLCLYDPMHSIQLRDSRQLVDLGVMSDGELMTEDDGNAAPLPTVDEYVAHMHDLIPGWFDEVDAAVFRAIDEAQRVIGVDGDLLEIGAYLGKSAILLGYLLRPQERLIVCDLFTNEHLDPEVDADAAFYGELSRAAFEKNYARFHRRPATVIQKSSTELDREGLECSFRIVHIDGSHRYDIVRQDIATALQLVVDGGIVVVDDYRTVPHALGVAAAVWESVTDGELTPVLASVQKLYGCAAGGAETTAKTLRSWALEEASLGGVRQHVAGHDMVVFAPPMGSPMLAISEHARKGEQPLDQGVEDVVRLQARLALIEGSRTWRLRNRLMRLIRRGRISTPGARE